MASQPEWIMEYAESMPIQQGGHLRPGAFPPLSVRSTIRVFAMLRFGNEQSLNWEGQR